MQTGSISSFGYFLDEYKLSRRDFSDLCKKKELEFSKSSVHRLAKGEINPAHFEEAKQILFEVVRDFLVLKQLGKKEIEIKINFTFSDIYCTSDRKRVVTKNITVPDGLTTNYIFKDSNGKTLSVLVFNFGQVSC